MFLSLLNDCASPLLLTSCCSQDALVVILDCLCRHSEQWAMPTTCCAVNCTNRHSSATAVTFHRFPQDPECRRLWIRAVSHDKLKDHHRICSDHFVSGKPSKDCDNVDCVLTVFNDGENRLVARGNPERTDRAVKWRKHVDEVNEVSFILVDFSSSSIDLGEVRSDNEEVTPITTDNLPSSGDVVTTLNAVRWFR